MGLMFHCKFLKFKQSLNIDLLKITSTITRLLRVIPCEITLSKNESLPIVFILSKQSVHCMRFHNPEYQPPATSGSRETGCTNSCYSGTRSHRRLIFRIMYSYRTYMY